MSEPVDLMAALQESLKDVRERTAPDRPQHTQECLDEALMFHAATGGDADCICGAISATSDATRETT